MKLRVLIIICFTVSLFARETYSYGIKRDSLKLRDTTEMVKFKKRFHKEENIRPVRNFFSLDSLKDIIYVDTISHNYIKEDTSKSSKHINNLIAKNLFKSVGTVSVDSTLIKISKYNEYKGETIDSIVFLRRNVFTPKDSYDNSLDKLLVNATERFSVLTKESTIRKYLLFKEGDEVVPEEIIQSEAMLRDLSSISRANISLRKDENGKLIAYVRTKDSWSLIAEARYRYTNNSTVSISDLDFNGTGNRLDIIEYLNVKNKEWFKAVGAAYTMPNMFGTFIEGKVGLGYGNKFHNINISAKKYFVTPNDWAGGAEYVRHNEERNLKYEDVFISEDKHNLKLWFGQSINISPRWGDNFFYTIKAEEVKFFDRPYYSSTYSPYFHNRRDILGSFGFYKEKFYRGNMIYGYGATESIPYGYIAEVIGGYRYGEFDDAPYLGTRLKIANKVNMGYIAASIQLGGFLQDKTSLQKTILITDFDYFTNLCDLGAGYYLRQFLSLNYSSAISTLKGYLTEISFNNSMRLASAANDRGTTRLQFESESVFFTPYHISGFRFTFFGFTDMGTLGYSTNPLDNTYYGIAGCGVRVRNEALIFKTIQLKVMFAFKGAPDFRNNLFYLNSNTTLSSERYIPKEPEIIDFKR